MFSGKKVWILGASSGIGAAVASLLAREGAQLALSARRKERLDEVLVSLEGDGQVALPLDVTHANELMHAVEKLRQQWQTIDTVFYCAGTYRPTPAAAFDAEAHHTMMSVNYGGLINTIDAVLPWCREQQASSIVAVASVVGYRAIPLASAYGASKSAMQYFCNAIRYELQQDGIKLQVVNPGFVETPLTEQNEFAMPCLMSVSEAAQQIVQGMKQGSREIHFPKRFSLVLKALGFLPERLYSWLLAKKVFGT